MAKSSKSAQERAEVAAAKEERVRDGKLALRDYQLNQSAVLANMQRLRTLRLARDSEPPLVAEPKPEPRSEPKRSAGKKSRAKKEEQ
jgi:hypothetical protein